MNNPTRHVLIKDLGNVLRRGFYVPSTHMAGMNLFLRQLAPKAGSEARPVLFVHGATLASYLWDVDLKGYSWMEELARQGRPTYGLDIRGYGASDKPAVMDQEAGASEPLARGTEAVEDIDDAINHLRTATGYRRIDLVGGSWGSITCGMYAAGPGRKKVHRLVLYAPIYTTANQEWLDMLADPQDPAKFNPVLGGYRWVTEEDVLLRWDKEIPVPDKEDWRPKQCFKVLMDEAFHWDPEGASRQPRAFRAPNGTLVDLFEAFSGRPLYDPQAIEVPTLLIRGADDPTATDEDAKVLFQKLGSEEKRYIAVGHGSHFFVAEKNRWQLFSESLNFLEY